MAHGDTVAEVMGEPVAEAAVGPTAVGAAAVTASKKAASLLSLVGSMLKSMGSETMALLLLSEGAMWPKKEKPLPGAASTKAGTCPVSPTSHSGSSSEHDDSSLDEDCKP